MIDTREEQEVKPIRVGYIRVSSIDDRQKLGYEAQKRILTNYGVDYLFAEKQSGKKDDRKEYNKAVKKAIRLAKTGNQVVFVVYKLDRLGRKASTLLNVLQEFEDADVKFTSLHEGIDTTTSMGKMMLQMLSIFAEMELHNISERTKLGLQQAKRDGVILGRPRIPDETRKEIQHLYQNSSMRLIDIAAKFNVSLGTVSMIARENGLRRLGR